MQCQRQIRPEPWKEESRKKLAEANVRRAVSVYCPELDKTWEGGYMEAARELDIKHECITKSCYEGRDQGHTDLLFMLSDK